ncbi:chemotaxis protein CheW [Azoarcus sp. KH32C]|uniref:chemotaxis protein CheW n=1 Tax=Azoarcus sp. KH32C TaxID=748247 RepID=UPI00023869C6|nr:chemotaxis protein CheW [Azoarcus sp. KH32C]BAL26478.1 positive regulator of CheA protein activity [Azoarcus sp. KH32C]
MNARLNLAEPIGVGQQQHLTFLLGGEMFAVGILRVKEIIEYGSLTTVPMMPDCIKGVINLRGAVVPVIDLARRFAGPATKINRRSCIVIIETTADTRDGIGHQDVGIIVDAVSEVLEIPSDQIEPPPAFGTHIRADFIAGMGKLDGRFVIILNVDKVLSMDELAALAPAPGIESREARAAA